MDRRSIQRDFEHIRSFLAERASADGTDQRHLVYSKEKKGYLLSGERGSLMTNSEILAVSKILLESRAFTRGEMEDILDKLIMGCVPLNNIKLVTELIANEKHHYVELHHQSHIQDKLWDLGKAIQKCRLLEITYHKQVSSKEIVKRMVEPMAVLFSEYYFYLNAYIVEPDREGNYKEKYNFPTIFRIDRIVEYHETEETFHVTYADRFEEGEFRKRVQFMYAGELQHLRIRYTGRNVEAILDRLPTAEVVKKEECGYIVEAEVYGKGIIMWLLSQGDNVEVLKPASIREELKQLLSRMLEKYE